MNLILRFTVVLVLCLTAVALSSVPARAQCGGLSLEISPKDGLPGTEVTVSSDGFTAGKAVDIYYGGTSKGEPVATGRISSKGDFTLSFPVPECCAGQYEVLADIGYTTVHTYFTVKPGLKVSPEKGPVGTNVTVEGRGFARNEQGIELIYYFDGGGQKLGSDIAANAKGSWETSFEIPFSTRGEHRLDAEGVETKLYQAEDGTFRVTAGIGLNTSSGAVGENITMTGSRFAVDEKSIKILFDGQEVVTGIMADSKGGWEASFQVPEMPTGTYDVAAQGESTKKEDIIALTFEIKPSIALFPTEGHVGTNLTVAGHGFGTGAELVITYNDAQVATPTANDKGSFDVSFLVPESLHGEHRVIAGYAGENHANAIFTMESDAPDIPELISPSEGSWVGLVGGKVTPTLQWSAVPDDSGVCYRLQIATSANVTATGEFADPLVSVPDIVTTNYTLNATQALPYGTYYWIVQAVDRAGNAGNWTQAYSFRAGLLPRWGFIAAIVAIVLLIGALVYFFVIKRRTYYYE